MLFSLAVRALINLIVVEVIFVFVPHLAEELVIEGSILEGLYYLLKIEFQDDTVVQGFYIIVTRFTF